jgi:putative aldouronate transport system substrate-binding protein
MKTKKTFGFIFLMITLLVIVCACEGKKTQQSSGVNGIATSGNIPLDENAKPSPFGRYKDPVTVEIVQKVDPTIAIPAGQSVNDNMFTRMIKEHFNIDIKIKWQAAPVDYDQKLQLDIASNTIPDILVVGEREFKQLIKSDMITDLTPYYETYASDIIKANINSTNGKAMAAASANGKMYALPGVLVEADGYNNMWIRQDWLDALGLAAPKTIDEVHAVARAFVANKMGGERTIGILSPTINSRIYNDFLSPQNNLNNLDGIFQACKSWPGFWIEGGDGKAVYGSITPETKAALGKLNEMFKSGALDQEFGIRKSAEEAWKSGQAGILFSPWWHGYLLPEALAVNPKASWRAYAAPLADDGKWYPKLATPGSFYVVARKGYEHPEVAILLNNLLRREESNFNSSDLNAIYWPGRVVITPMDENDVSVIALRKLLNGEEVPKFDSVDYKLLTLDLETVKKAKKEPYNELNISAWDINNENFGRIYSLLVGSGAVTDANAARMINKVYSLTYQQTPAMERRWTNLKKKEDETFMKIIIGELPLSAFDTFVLEWKAEGGDEITKEVQDTL